MTQHDKIIETMVGRREKDWWYAPEFMTHGSIFFVGYEASARISELAKWYPEMIEPRRRGKYREIRIRYENIEVWWRLVPESFIGIMQRAGIQPAAVKI